MKTITYTAAADRFLFSQPESVRERIEDKIVRYALTGEGDIRALRGSNELRLRVGSYRVVFTETKIVLSVENIGDRSKIYI